MRHLLGPLGIAATLLFLVGVVLAAFGIPPGHGIQMLYEGAFGDGFAWSRTAVKMTPLLLTGLGMVIAWRAGMFNIGGEGQFLIGALFSGFLYKLLAGSLAGPVGSVLLLLAATLGGALWALLAGWMYVKRGVDIVIGTILLNFVAIQILAYAVDSPLRAPGSGVPLSLLVTDEYMLPRLNRQMDVHAGVLLAVLLAFAVHLFLFRSIPGYKIRLVGESPRMARANLIDSGRSRLLAITLSGALCGLAGGIEHIAMARQLGAGFSQNWGFLGIPVALISGLSPIGTILGAGFFGALFAGSDNLARFTSGGPTLIYIIQAVAVFAVVGFRYGVGARVGPTPRLWFRRVRPSDGNTETT